MFDGPSVAAALRDCGVTHVVWIPDSELGTWEPALTATPGLTLVRVCREGEAFAVAAGLWLGGKQPIILIQCTVLFEAGDALRNALHDLQLPLFFVVGVRSYYAHLQGATADTCPIYTAPILEAWQVPYVTLDNTKSAVDLANAFREAQEQKRCGAALLAE